MTWRLKMDVPEAVEIVVNHASLDPDATYTVATNTYVVDQAAKYLPGATPKNVQEQGETVFDVALRAVSEGGAITVPSEKRLIQLE